MPGAQDIPPELRDVADERRALLNLGYRLLGSVTDAEDAIGETYLRWYKLTPQQRRDIDSPLGWMLKTAGRICLDMLGSARARREHYVGQWLPEPLPGPGRWTSGRAGDELTDPADQVTMDESVSMALLLVLDTLTPAERVSFVLHDVFRYRFDEIAEIVGRSPGACRQLASSARRRIHGTPVGSAGRRPPVALVATFKAAWESGEVGNLLRVLDPEATAVTDGGGLVSAAAEPITGAHAVAEFLLAVYRRQPDLVLDHTDVNGEPGLTARSGAGGEVLAVLSFTTRGDRVDRIWVVRNPEKLGRWR
ncbi:RNA polymerase sigma factor SigJ [Nocardia carnea]|uniref:RNA polymerase sigma factor SigJ n=1 Tax=Nocardia carnea TaxID=37328 RepID=UPI002454EECC|nr:RNA polymerase sigma factor SigJ [Nocardia carnea]